MVTSIGLGEIIPRFVIGKSASQRCLKHICNFSCRYRSQNKAWMDGTLFEEWLHELDHKFEMQGRKVTMIDDNNYPSRSFRSESYHYHIGVFIFVVIVEWNYTLFFSALLEDSLFWSYFPHFRVSEQRLEDSSMTLFFSGTFPLPSICAAPRGLSDDAFF